MNNTQISVEEFTDFCCLTIMAEEYVDDYKCPELTNSYAHTVKVMKKWKGEIPTYGED